MARFSPVAIKKIAAPKLAHVRPIVAVKMPSLKGIGSGMPGGMPHSGYGLAPEHPMLMSDAFHKNLK